MAPKRVSPSDLLHMKRQGERIVVLTAYDYTSAQILEAARIPVLLVGDSLGMVLYGHESTVPVTLDDMIRHCRAVVRGTSQALVIGDMPFMTYASETDALRNVARLLQDGGCQAVKVEGGREIAAIVSALGRSGVAVCAHLGYTPQSGFRLGRPGIQGGNREAAKNMILDALALQDAGAFALVLELVPEELAAEISARLDIPTIGIGAGVKCDGEVQVFHDVFGLYQDFVPRHTRRYVELAPMLVDAAKRFASDVRANEFPTRAQSASMDAHCLQQAIEDVDTGER